MKSVFKLLQLLAGISLLASPARALIMTGNDGAGVGKWSGSGNIKPDGTIDFTGMPDGEYRLRSQPNPGKPDRTYVPEQIITLAPGASRDVTFVYP